MRHIRKILPFVRPYWKRAVVALILLTLVVFIDLAIPRLIQRIIDQGITAGNMGVVVSTTILMLVISLVQTYFAIENNVFSILVGEGTARDLREALFLKIQSFSFGNLDRLNTGQLMVRLSSDTSVIQRLVQVSLRIGTRAPLLMVGSLILMFNTDSHLALMMMPLLLATGLLLAFFVSKMGNIFSIVQKKLDWLNTVLQENIAGVRMVKAFVREDYERERFAQANEAYTRYSIRVMEFMSTLPPAMSVFVNIGIVLVIWAGGTQAIRGQVTVGQIVAFINYLQTTLGPLIIMVMLANVAAAGMASAERVAELLETAPEVQDDAHPLPLPERAEAEVVFENVGFHYNGSGEAVLKGINLTAKPGQTVAILGATGAGKSSLVNLVPRFYDPTEGRLLLNGVDSSKVRQDTLLAQIGIVPQDTVLFSGTVRDNIRYGKPDADEAEVIAAAKAAQAHEFIAHFPDGYDTHIEERGVNLSGGQKQRIAIARALLTRPAILILDDSTSSVDVETETRIQAALKKWMKNSTGFVVAQRISTVLNADKIIVIDAGRIVAEGTHHELMQSSPIYQEIYASQLGNGLKLEGGQIDV
jgi:ATP-binding cassette subfamily B multidrug efflux pump